MDYYNVDGSYDDHIVDCLGCANDHRDYLHDARHGEYNQDDSYNDHTDGYL